MASKPSASEKKSARRREVSDVQVDVSDYGAGRHTGPCRRSGGALEPLYLAIGCHHQLTANATPSAARTIRIHLDPQVVGVLQIQGLAHEMVSSASCRAGSVRGAGHETTE